MTVEIVSDDTFEQDVLHSSMPVLVDFFAEWCGPCKAMAPALEQVAEEFGGKIRIVKIDADESPASVQRCGVRSLPTLVMFNAGKPVARHVGPIAQRAKLAAWIDATATPSDLAAAAPTINQFKLPNGLDVVVISSAHMDGISHALFHKVGFADAPVGKSGLTHMLGRLLARVPACERYQEKAGATQDAVSFAHEVSRDQLGSLMQASADRMRLFEIAPDALRDERQTQMEWAQLAGGGIEDLLNAALFRRHNYSVPIAGRPYDIASITPEVAAEFHARFFGPGNAVLAVAGAVTPAEVRELAEATYGTLPVSPGVARAARPALAAPDSPFRCNVALSGPQRTVLHRKYLVPSYATAQPGEAEALEIVAQILGRRSGILRSLLVEEGLATRAGATFRGQDLDAGVLDIGIGAASENLGAVEEALDRAVETIRDGTLAQEKIELAKEALITGCLGERLSARRQAALYGAGIAVGRTVRQIEGYTAAVAKVTAEDVRLAATKYLDPRRAVTGYLRCAPAAE